MHNVMHMIHGRMERGSTVLALEPDRGTTRFTYVYHVGASLDECTNGSCDMSVGSWALARFQISSAWTPGRRYEIRRFELCQVFSSSAIDSEGVQVVR
jgi:hypothetical protein